MAEVVVDDTWADGTRTDTNLPAESAWFASNAASLTVASGTMTGATSTSSRTWWTYFTTTSTNAIQIAPGETLKISVIFVPNGVNSSNTSRGFRVGVFNFTGGTRSVGDGNSPAGAGVVGYLLNMNFGETFGVNNPLEIRERTNVTSTDLMGSSSDYTSLGSGGGSAGGAGFASGSEYTLEFSVKRTGTGTEITTTVLGPAGWSISHTAATDMIVDKFDGFALRPINTAQTAASFAFKRFDIELLSAGLSAPTIAAQPQSQTVTVGQNAVLSIGANGTAPLSYQWFKGGQSIAGETSPSLTLSNVQLSDAGSYTVTVTNGAGSATSSAAALTVNGLDPTATPGFELEGFAALDGFASNGTWQPGGTTGGAGGAHVQVSTVSDLVTYLESTAPYVVEVLNDIDLAPLANHSGGFPADYPTGEILVRSNKTIYSKNGATLRHGTLRIGKASLGAQKNLIVRNLRFRDLWVLDPSGNYDTYGWDYIHIEEGSHHIWVDHCDFEKSYDGMIDMTHAADFVTVSWNVFRSQKKCHLIGHSDSNAAEDTGHLNVTFHHNYYVDVDERLPRMRFGNAHVFNLYSENLGGNGIQSTADAATLVENSYFRHPKSGSLPSREENGGLFGTIKVSGSIIENLPGVNIVFRERNADNFTFNAPFAGVTPPYAYTLDSVSTVPTIVTRYAGVGKLGFVFWQRENFTSTELADPTVSGPEAVLTGDGATNLVKYALGVQARQFLPASAAPVVGIDGNGIPFLRYERSSFATDIAYCVEASMDLVTWSSANVNQQRVATEANGVEAWEARYVLPRPPQLFFRLVFAR